MAWGTGFGRSPMRPLDDWDRFRLWLARKLLKLAAVVWPPGYPWGGS